MANSDMKEALELERRIYEEMKAREDASRQREADETADMFNERELARLQDENRRLRAFVEALALKAPIKYLAVEHVFYNYYAHIVNEAAALLASMKPAEDSDKDTP